MVSLGGCPGPRLGGWSQASMTVAIRCKSLKSIAAIPVWCPRLRQSQRRTADQINSTLSSCENCLLASTDYSQSPVNMRAQWEQMRLISQSLAGLIGRYLRYRTSRPGFPDGIESWQPSHSVPAEPRG